uniref:Uncharacterized protein n=1 Tax=Triticum urartu TaxID=4572 RepID=A0A8R7U402_TRIUA
MCYCKVMPKLANFQPFWWLCSSSKEVTFRGDWRRHGSYSQFALTCQIFYGVQRQSLPRSTSTWMTTTSVTPTRGTWSTLNTTPIASQ